MVGEIEIKFVLRGDDIEMLTEALKHIPLERGDIAGYLCYLKNEIADQTGVEKTWDTSNWTEEDWDKFFKEIEEDKRKKTS